MKDNKVKRVLKEVLYQKLVKKLMSYEYVSQSHFKEIIYYLLLIMNKTMPDIVTDYNVLDFYINNIDMRSSITDKIMEKIIESIKNSDKRFFNKKNKKGRFYRPDMRYSGGYD